MKHRDGEAMPETIWANVDRDNDPSVDLHASRTKDYDWYVEYTRTSSITAKLEAMQQGIRESEAEAEHFKKENAEYFSLVENMKAKMEVAEKMAEALKYYANEKMYEEMKVYRGEPMSEAYQIEVYPILEGEKYHVAQEALAHWHTVNGAAKERGG